MNTGSLLGNPQQQNPSIPNGTRDLTRGPRPGGSSHSLTKRPHNVFRGQAGGNSLGDHAPTGKDAFNWGTISLWETSRFREPTGLWEAGRRRRFLGSDRVPGGHVSKESGGVLTLAGAYRRRQKALARGRGGERGVEGNKRGKRSNVTLRGRGRVGSTTVYGGDCEGNLS